MKKNKQKIIYNNCESHKMGATKITSECLGMRDGLSVDMLALSWRNLVPLVLAPQPKIASYAPDIVNSYAPFNV